VSGARPGSMLDLVVLGLILIFKHDRDPVFRDNLIKFSHYL